MVWIWDLKTWIWIRKKPGYLLILTTEFNAFSTGPVFRIQIQDPINVYMEPDLETEPSLFNWIRIQKGKKLNLYRQLFNKMFKLTF